MTRRVSLFDSPFLLGFEEVEQALDRVARSASDGYPPYNIEQLSETHLRITIAVAGFALEDLSVQLEQNQLVIRGKRRDSDDEQQRVFLHRGIATRQFQRSFVLSDEIEVAGSTLDSGLLHIDLRRILPDIKIQTIEIKQGKQAKKGQTIDVSGQKD